MRGVVLEFSDLSGTGLISGDDNGRYSLSKEDVRSTTPVKAGQKVDFEPGEDGVARAIFIMENAGSGSTATPAAAAASASAGGSAGAKPWNQYDLPPDHKSLRYGLNPFQFFGKCMSLYFDGRGRATVAEYWSFMLVQYLILFVGFFFVALIAGVMVESGSSRQAEDAIVGLMAVFFLIVLAGLIIPSITVSIRRLHDIGASGWVYLIILVPYLGGLALFVMSLVGSQRQANQYGPYYRDVLDGTANVKEVFG